MRSKYYILGGIAIVAITGAVIMFFRNSNSAMKKFAAGNNVVSSQNNNGTDGNAATSATQPAQFCPQPEMLIKKDVKWTTADNKWENYTPSSATKVLNFIGAQWVGIKVGKIICLYQTDEAVSFPVALEQTRSQLVIEPRSAAWSGLISNRKFCKSASVADCSYFFAAPANVSNVYKEIEYAPNKGDVG